MHGGGAHELALPPPLEGELLFFRLTGFWVDSRCVSADPGK
jgi:hypothetical protein